MRYLVFLGALLMPVVSWLSQRGAFGPDIGAVSDRYPTLVAAAGYAFTIWALIFLADVAFGVLQLARPVSRTVNAVRAPAALGFAATALWMPVFSQQLFWLALMLIWLSFGCLAYSADRLSADMPWLSRSERWMAWAPLSLHAGWLSVAAFLNTAQVIVAYRLGGSADMLGWSAALFFAAAVTVLLLNHRMRGNAVFVAAVVWALVAMYVQQSRSQTPGAKMTASLAIGIACLLVLQTTALLLRHRTGSRQRRSRFSPWAPGSR